MSEHPIEVHPAVADWAARVATALEEIGDCQTGHGTYYLDANVMFEGEPTGVSIGAGEVGTVSVLVGRPAPAVKDTPAQGATLPRDVVEQVARAVWVAGHHNKEWAEGAWVDMGGSEPDRERADLEVAVAEALAPFLTSNREEARDD